MSPLEVPEIDSRRYAELVEELVARIPVYTPEWTDHEEGDPGITLLQLLVYMGESLEYRFNLIPEPGSSPIRIAIRERLQAKIDCLSEETERISRALAELDATEPTDDRRLKP